MLNYPAWKNGKYCKVQDLTVSILDLGLIHCDATYDVIAVKGGEIQNLEAHMSRFVSSCYGWRLPLKYSDEDLEIVFQTLVAQAPTEDLLLWVGITRGIPSTGNPRDLISCEPNIFAYTKPYFGFNKLNSATVCLSRQIRNDSFDQTMKNFAWNDLSLAQWEASDRGFDTAVLLDRNGYLTEGPGFNVGIITNGIVYAPRCTRLQGTVMDIVKKRCDDNNIQFMWSNIPRHCISVDADAMFLTSTAGSVIPVKRFEGRYFSDDRTLTWLQNNI